MRRLNWAKRIVKKQEDVQELLEASEHILQRQIERRIHNWMTRHVGEYVDSFGEVQLTELAEAACERFNDYEGDEFNIPEEYFEISFEVGERYEKWHPIR